MTSDATRSDSSSWSFWFDDKGFLRLRLLPALPSTLEVPLVVVLSDVGEWPIDIRDYREAWREHRETRFPDPLCGDAACVSAERDEVVIQSVFDSWPTVSMPLMEFEAMLDAYYRYIVELVGGENVEPEEED